MTQLANISRNINSSRVNGIIEVQFPLCDEWYAKQQIGVGLFLIVLGIVAVFATWTNFWTIFEHGRITSFWEVIILLLLGGGLCLLAVLVKIMIGRFFAQRRLVFGSELVLWERVGKGPEKEIARIIPDCVSFESDTKKKILPIPKDKDEGHVVYVLNGTKKHILHLTRYASEADAVVTMLGKNLAAAYWGGTEEASTPMLNVTTKNEKPGLLSILFSLTPLQPKKCLLINMGWGLLLGAAGLLVRFMPTGSHNIEQFKFIWMIQLGAGIPLLLGSLWLIPRMPHHQIVLRIQGLVFIGMALFYTFFMWLVLGHGPISGRAGHAPGILAAAMGYGARQFMDFSGRAFDRKTVRNATIGFVILGALCDIFVLYLVFKAFFIIFHGKFG